MRYGFINNFSQTLAADLAAGATTMTLDGGGSSLSAASADLVYTLTLDDGEGSVEIVHVTGASANTLTISKGQEGTADAAWPSGTTVEMRVTAAVLGERFIQNGWDGDPTDNNLALGNGATVDGSGGYVYHAIAIGSSALTSAGSAIAIGQQATASASDAVAIGRRAEGTGYASVSIGSYAESPGQYSAALANYADASGQYSLAAGYATTAGGKQSIAIGYVANASAVDSIAIGPGAEPQSAGAMAVFAVPVLTYKQTDYLDSATPNAARLTSSRVVIQTDTLNFTSLSDSFTIDIPASPRSCVLLIDQIDVVLLSADTISAAPQVKLGTTAGGADILAATSITVTATHERQIEASLIPEQGVTAVHAEVATAATATAMTGRVVLHGYVMEV